jgi:hypothetical protein
MERFMRWSLEMVACLVRKRDAADGCQWGLIPTPCWLFGRVAQCGCENYVEELRFLSRNFLTTSHEIKRIDPMKL